MSTPKAASTHRFLGLALMAAVAAACGGGEPAPAPEPAPEPAIEAPSPPASLPRVSDLPSGYQPIGELAGRGVFYTAGDAPAARKDDGNHYHGYDGPGVWAEEPKGVRNQGVLYGVDDGAIVSAGYLLRQADLTAGRSFHGLTLREIDLPPARAMTVDFIEGESAESNQFLMLWHFLPATDAPPMLPVGELPPLAAIPEGFVVYACDQFPDLFCPGMGRHYTDPNSLGRNPDAEGNEGVIYGEAAEKLIFIEYVLGQEELAAGVSWPAMPLDDVPIPPIDNVHVLHFGDSDSADGRYTVHMYFLPEDVYLAWKTEPETL